MTVKYSPQNIASILRGHYKDYCHSNKKNPLDELLFILFSVTKTEAIYTRTYKNFKKYLPCHADILSASIKDIAKVIHNGGQSTQKATAIKGIVEVLNKQFGRPTLAPLKNMSDKKCEEFLTSLPRVGKKVARCVMLYSFGRTVFPVDVHCRRIAIRLGWIGEKGFDEDVLQAIIPPELRFSLHVNFISLGREFCKSRKPTCSLCPINHLCPKIGVYHTNWGHHRIRNYPYAKHN